MIAVLKLLCPHCYKSVTVPESAAGTDAPCPDCGQSFPVPAKYNPTVGPAPMPPPPPPPAPVPLPAPPPVVPTAPLPTAPGYTHSRGITISPCVVGWIPAAALAGILLLTLLPWVGVYPGGHPVYTQGAWRAITGWPKRSIQLEDLLMKELPGSSVYDRAASDWFIMLPYVLVLILATVVAWSDRLELKAVESRIPTLWPFRHGLLAGLAGAALLLLVVEATRGFGLERAMHAAVSEKFAEQRQKAGSAVGEQEKVDFRENQELASYGVERTGWFCFAMTLHVVVLLAMLANIGLARRGNKPPPRIAIHY